jgi:hypothetical protein
MNRPPMLVTLKVGKRYDDDQGRGINLWIPLFIIVPIVLIILLALFLLVLPFFLLYVLLTWNLRWWPYLKRGVPAFFETMHATQGLKVDVEDRKQNIYIDVH